MERNWLKREGKWQNLVTKQGLMKIKTRALRRRVWFRALSRVERGIVDLTIRCVERIRSPFLARTVLNIINKILKTLENGFLDKVDRVGKAIAQRVCGIAEGWGNDNTSRWKHDPSFVRFLGVNAVNSRGFGVYTVA